MHKKYGKFRKLFHRVDILVASMYFYLNPYLTSFCASLQGLFTAPHNLHKARREPLNHFSKTSVAARQEIINRNIIKFCDRISQFSGKMINLGAAISALTRDVANEFMLDKSYRSLDQDDFNIAVTNMLQEGGMIWRITKHMPFFGPMTRSIPPSIMFKLVDEGTKAFLQYVLESEVDTKSLLRVANTPPSDDESSTRTIVHEMVDSKLPPDEKKFEHVFNDVATITGAGFETTASVLRLIMFHVFSNQMILQRLRAEVATASGTSSSNDATIEVKTLEQLPYLTSVIMEGMRLSPAIGSRIARIAPDRDLFYGNLRIPTGTPVGMTTILMHTDETLYPEPLSFNPDRWMDPEAGKKLDKTYVLFSRGTRICLGMHPAWAEMYLIIPRTV
ncbi:putative cytochrome p450 protein [Eutypa lata UCREL1]|uniref:Putative cytochrome p450 protein n=1 Tax=Eutypa lata (strain UCR-EL1) TaxID=1287681 RepID=M7SWU6_EUTLA|nr:putative cytochrome p450 protein [Eutypa lata UCREL1]